MDGNLVKVTVESAMRAFNCDQRQTFTMTADQNARKAAIFEASTASASKLSTTKNPEMNPEARKRWARNQKIAREKERIANNIALLQKEKRMRWVLDDETQKPIKFCDYLEKYRLHVAEQCLYSVDHVTEVLKLHWASVVGSLVESRQVIVKGDETADLSKTKPPPENGESEGAERPQASPETTPSKPSSKDT